MKSAAGAAQPTPTGTYSIVEPDYKFESRLAPRHQNNPLISGLALGQITLEGLGDLFDLRPSAPTAETRRLPEMARLGELKTLNDLVYCLPQYTQAATTLITGLRETYVARNALSPLDRHRRYLLHNSASYENGLLRVPLPPRLRLTATSLAMLGPPGAGKSTFAKTICPHFEVIVRHSNYRGAPLICDQLPLIYLQVPHDSTVKSFCQQFLLAIDTALGYTEYYREGKGATGIGEMVIIMVRAATAVSLGGLFIDDFQNLRVARGPGVVIMLNLLSGLIEQAGISVFSSGTPSVAQVLVPGTANHRKLSLSGEINFPIMKWGSAELEDFMDVVWDYQYVAHRVALNPTIRRAWWQAGGGNPAFMVLAFGLAQRNEIGGREIVDELALEKASLKNMAMLRPAIRAMRQGTLSALQALDGMALGADMDHLRQELGLPTLGRSSYPMADGSEYPDVEAAEEKAERSRRGHAARKGTGADLLMPALENPLLMQ